VSRGTVVALPCCVVKTTSLWLVLASLIPGVVLAHGLDANRIEAVLRARDLELVVTPPAEYLRAADANGDLFLVREEVAAHRAWIKDAVTRALTVRDLGGARLEIIGVDVSTPAYGPAGTPQDHVRYTLRGRFDADPTALQLGVSFVTPDHPVTVLAARAVWSDKPGLMKFVGPRQSTFLTVEHPQVVVLRADGAAASAVTSVVQGAPNLALWPAVIALLASAAALLLLPKWASRRTLDGQGNA